MEVGSDGYSEVRKENKEQEPSAVPEALCFRKQIGVA